MAGTRKMDMVSDIVYDASGLNVLYGPGELHDPGSLPDDVPRKEVLVTEAEAVSAPVHAQAKDPAGESAANAAEFEKLQTASSPGAAPPAEDKAEADEPPARDKPVRQTKAAAGKA